MNAPELLALTKGNKHTNTCNFPTIVVQIRQLSDDILTSCKIAAEQWRFKLPRRNKQISDVWCLSWDSSHLLYCPGQIFGFAIIAAEH